MDREGVRGGQRVGWMGEREKVRDRPRTERRLTVRDRDRCGGDRGRETQKQNIY